MKLLMVLLMLALTSAQASEQATPTIGADAVGAITSSTEPLILAGGPTNWEYYNRVIRGGVVCDVNDLCEMNEDCDTCQDCDGGPTQGASCGNGVCEAGDGENCLTCAADCNGQQKGKPANRFCCGSDTLCSDSRCSSSGFACTDITAPTSFCCPNSPATEDCGSGLDEDCDNLIDCDDNDCATNPLCTQCQLGQKGDACTDASECCSNKCKGKPGQTTCR